MLATAAIVAGTCSGCLYVLHKSPPSTDLVYLEPSRVARGEYLVKHVAVCFACHPQSATLTAQSHFLGNPGVFPGNLWAPNITNDPDTGIGNWTDGQVIRAIREGTNNNDEALTPSMPYASYRQMSDEDTRSVVAYLRKLPPLRLKVPERQLDFPYSLLINLLPAPVEVPLKTPDRNLPLAYGEYLSTIARCDTCHSPWGPNGPDLRRRWRGGLSLEGQGQSTVVSPNITSDRQAGIGGWSDRMVARAIAEGIRPNGQALDPVMPSAAYQGLTAQDLAAIVAYVRKVPPAR